MRTLSDKRREIRCTDGGIGWGYPDVDVKDFIKQLKEKFCLTNEDNCNCHRCRVIDTLAGEKLI
jgi:hypothetical protein